MSFHFDMRRLTMKYILFAILLISCNNNLRSNRTFKVEEDQVCIISKPLSISFQYNKVLFADITGKLVCLYSREGKILKTFAPEMRFSDSIALLQEKPKNKRFVLIDEYAQDYPQELENGGLQNALGNMYTNCCFKDSNTIVCGGIFGVLIKKPKYAKKSYGISTQTMINEYSLLSSKIKSIPLPEVEEPYGVLNSETMFYLEKTDNYVMDFSTFKKPEEDSIPYCYALSKMDKDGKFQKVFFEVPKVLQSPFLSDDFIRICATGDDSLWCAFPKITKIYNPESTSSFELKLKNNSNNLFLDSMSFLIGKYSDEIDKRINQLYAHLRYQVESICNFHNNILVFLRDLIDKKHILQLYTTKGKFLKEVIYEEFSESEEIAGIAYAKDTEEFIFISMKDEEWFFTYKKVEEVF